jgi:hypothetical protein
MKTHNGRSRYFQVSIVSIIIIISLIIQPFAPGIQVVSANSNQSLGVENNNAKSDSPSQTFASILTH